MIFLNKVAGYLALPESVFLGTLRNFWNRFYKKDPQMAIKMLLKYIFQKKHLK